jgi:glycosyltransferase involved in cell wall biosynthesis
MPSPRPVVLVDATLLRTVTGFYGMGRFAYDLLHGLAQTRADWQGRLSIATVTRLRLPARFTTSEDLAAAADEAIAERGTVDYHETLARRRLLLGAAAHRAGASLVHMTQEAGAPIVLRLPRIATCHDIIPLVYPREYIGGDPDDGLALAWRTAYARRFAKDLRRYRRAARVVAISERSRDDLVTILGVARARVDVVPNGVDLTRFEGATSADDAARRAALGVGRRPYAVYVGACDWRKNLPGVFAAVNRARREVDLELVWAGRVERHEAERIEREAREAGIRPHLRRLGFVSDADLPALYRGAVAHVFLSRLEGFGLTVVEAMASGCSVVVGRGSATDEIAGDAGIIVDPEDVESAGAALARLAREPDERARLVALGRARARHFDRARMALGYVESYLRALGERARSSPE